MLYVNKELYQLSKKDIELIKSKLHLPIRIVYTSEQIKPSKLNPVPDKPASISIPLKSSLRTKEGLMEYRYAENIVQDSTGKTRYIPHTFPFFGDRLLTEYDIEFIWFIYFWCPYCKNNSLQPEQRKRSRFEIEDTITNAELKADRKREIAKVNSMIYDYKVGLSEENLRKIGKAYFIPNVDGLTRAQVELAVENIVFAEERNKKGGFKRFLDISHADSELESKGKIQKALDRGIIRFVSQRRMWVWLDDQGNSSEEICRITGGRSPFEALHNWMGANKEFREALEDHLQGQPVIVKKKEEII